MLLKPGPITQTNGCASANISQPVFVLAVYGLHQAKMAAYSKRRRLAVEAKFVSFACAAVSTSAPPHLRRAQKVECRTPVAVVH
jgi:hypothetical protein